MKTNHGRPGPTFVGLTYIGAVVGAGFASGQEILQFFTLYGPIGGCGIAVACAMFIVYGARLLQLGYTVQASSYADVVRTLGRPWLTGILDATVALFLVSSLIAMAAGAGAVASQLGVASPAIGSIAMLVAAAITVVGGVGAVVGAIGGIAPFMVAAVVVVSLASLVAPQDCLGLGGLAMLPPVNHWAAAAFLYASFNMLGAIAILAPLGASLRSKSDAWRAALVGGFGLGLGAFASHLAMLSNAAAQASEVPLIALAGSVNEPMSRAYAVVIIAEVYTTAVAALYGLMARLHRGQRSKRSAFMFRLIVLVALAWLFGQLGLQGVVRIIYPAMGVVGVVLLSALTWQPFLRVLLHRRE